MWNDSYDGAAMLVHFLVGTNTHPTSSIPDNNLGLGNDVSIEPIPDFLQLFVQELILHFVCSIFAFLLRK